MKRSGVRIPIRSMRAFATVLLAALGLANLAAGAERTLNVAGRRLVVEVPPGYSFTADRDDEGSYMIRMENPVWQISVMALVIVTPDPEVKTAEWLRNQLITQTARALPDAKEKDYNVKPLPLDSGVGAYCVFTDANHKPGDALPPGQYLNLTGAIKSWAEGFIYCEILSNGVSSPEYREVFDAFRTTFTTR